MRLELSSLLGAQAGVPGSLAYLDDSDVQFVAGRCIVRFDTETRIQTIIPGALSGAGIVAVANSHNNKYIAYAERVANGSAAVYVYEWSSKRKRKLVLLENGNAGVAQLSFSKDGKTLLVLGGAPEWSLRLVAWEKGSGGRVVGTISSVPPGPNRPVSAVAACPGDSDLIAACGRGFFRMYRFVEGNLKTLSVNLKKDPSQVTTDFTALLWLSEERMVASSAAGEVFVFNGSEMIRVLEAPASACPGFMRDTGGPRNITCLTAFSKGFIAGCEGGILRVFEKHDDPRVLYRCTRSVAIRSGDAVPMGCGGAAFEENSAIESVVLSPNEEDIVALASSGQMYRMKFGALELHRASHAVDPNGTHLFRPLHATFHSVPRAAVPDVTAASSGGTASIIAAATGKNRGFTDIPSNQQGVVSMSLCTRKPLFATSGADKTVRVWNLSGTSMGAANINGIEAAPQQAGGMDSLLTLDATPVLELVQQFKELPSCVALHPTGNFIAIGLETCMQLCSLVLGHQPPHARMLKEYPIWHAADIAFSNGGSLLAAAAGTTITVISPWTGATVATLRGHGDKVIAIAWSADDRCLVSTGRDSAVIRWAVAVPNAMTGGGSGLAALQVMAGGQINLQSAAGDHAERGGSMAAPTPSAPSMVGTVLCRVDILDFTPLGLALGAADSGRDVFVTGVVMSAGASGSTARSSITGPQAPSYIPVLRHIVLDASSVAAPAKEGVRMADGVASNPTTQGESLLSTEPQVNIVRAVAVLPSSKALIAGVGKCVVAPLAISTHASHADASVQSDGQAPPSSPSKQKVGGSTPITRAGSPMKATLERSSSSTALIDAPVHGSVEDHVGHVKLHRIASALGAAEGNGSSRPSKDSGYADAACHSAPVVRIAVSRDEGVVLTAAADGSIAVWRVVHTGHTGGNERLGGHASTAAGNVDRLPPSDSVLVPRQDIDELRKDKLSLDMLLLDLTVSNRRNERLKAVANDSRMSELQTRFGDDLDMARSRTVGVVQSKSRMEGQYENQIGALSQSQARELQELETVYGAKLAGELARYDKLVAERDRITLDATNAAATLADRHGEEIEGVRAQFESLLAEEGSQVASLEAERAEIAADSVRAAQGLEHDVEGEMAGLRTRFEMRLVAENKSTLRLRGENGFMKRKFIRINREISEQKDELAALNDKEKELNDAIANLTKDVAGHKKEIREREETVADKDSRIYELKKKNQELEKFKFVLNYKIQELKRQIMPRKKEIADMREQLKEMELELLQYHKSNAALDLMIGELKLKRDGIHREVQHMDEVVVSSDAALSRIARDLVAVAGASTGKEGSASNKAVRSAMVQLYAKYVHGEEGGMKAAMAELGATLRSGAAEGKEGGLVVPPGVNVEELADELARQRRHLERNVTSVSRKMATDEASAAKDRDRLLRENTALTQEVNDLRRDLRYVQSDVAAARKDLIAVSSASLASLRNDTAGMTNTGPGASLRRTAALQGVVGAAATGPGVNAPMGLLVAHRRFSQPDA